MADIRKHLSARIRALRERAGLTQKALGDLVQMDKMTIWRIEQGESWPVYENLERISQALGTDIEYLFQGLDSGTAPAPTDAEILSRISGALGLASRLGPDITSFILAADEADLSSVRFLIEAQIKAVRAAEAESPERQRKDREKA